jgi:hypothetical protein
MASESQLTVGGLVDALVKAAQAETNPAIGLTQFIEKVAREANLSARHISRIRDSSDFPESEAVLKLANAIPQVSILDPSDIANRLLWDWQNIEYDQDNLIEGRQKGHSVTIFSGWQAPIALQNEDVVRSIARNIQEGFTYTFIYPSPDNYPKSRGDGESRAKGWIEELRNKVSGAWIYNEMNQSIAGMDRLQLAEKISKFLEKLDKKIQISYTKPDAVIWFDLPSNYSIFYNLCLMRKDKKSRYGSFRVEGQLMKSITQMDILSGGWLYTTKDQYEIVESSYKQDVAKWEELIDDSFKAEI